MGLCLNIKEGKSFKLGLATITITKIKRGSCSMNIEAPKEIEITRKMERDLIFDVLKTLRERDEKSIDKAIDMLADYVKNQYIDEEVNA